MNEEAIETRDQLREVFIGRQPILDKDQGLAGYELLFRPTKENSAHVDSETAATTATADVICKAFAELGLSNVFGQARAFVNVDALFLESDLVELLPRDIVVLETDVAAFADPALLPRCQELKAKGYAFSISGITDVDDRLWPLVDLATWLKINVDGLPGERLQTAARALGTTRRTLIAAHVESQSQMELCRLLGFHLFQGYYFAKPTIIAGRKLDHSQLALMRLTTLLLEDADTAELEKIFKQEPGLVVNLLRLTNSVASGVRTRITSLRHAITVLGRRQLQRWLQLLLFAGQQGGSASPLLQLAATRGRLMELLAEKLRAKTPELAEQAFMTGIMSLMPALLSQRMEDILVQLPVAPAMAQALTGERSGVLGNLLQLAEASEDGDSELIESLLPQLYGINAAALNNALSQALAWANNVSRDSGAE